MCGQCAGRGGVRTLLFPPFRGASDDPPETGYCPAGSAPPPRSLRPMTSDLRPLPPITHIHLNAPNAQRIQNCLHPARGGGALVLRRDARDAGDEEGVCVEKTAMNGTDISISVGPDGTLCGGRIRSQR